MFTKNSGVPHNVIINFLLPPCS